MGMSVQEQRQTWSHSLIETERDGGGYRVAYEMESVLGLPLDMGVDQR